MAVKLRLARQGTHKRPHYWLVATESTMPRDGRYLEKLGIFNPRTQPATLNLKTDRVNHWLDHGAVPTEAVRELLREAGILKLRAAAKAPKPAAAEPAPAETPTT